MRAVLGIEQHASALEVKTAYRQLAMKHHPDRSNEANAAAKIAELNAAYEILSDPLTRQVYDDKFSDAHRDLPS